RQYEAGLNGMLFINSTIHEFDLARWLMGDEVDEVHSYATVRGRPEVARFGDIVAGVVNLRFQQGAIGNVESYVQSEYGYDIRTEIVGTEGTLMIGYLRETAETILTSRGGRHDIVGHYLDRFAGAYVDEVRDFARTVLAGRAPRISGEDGWRALAIAESALQSYQLARPVAVRQGLK
ncbi:MAG TPA: Gfo/Idh/MocA family oxidoreductase, partial [Terriglobia bacterium]|nr:Gfo/Idh/MocA family oxidoreductase [Terriglobia bacterium]